MYMYMFYGYIMYTAGALNRFLFHKRCDLNILFAYNVHVFKFKWLYSGGL